MMEPASGFQSLRDFYSEDKGRWRFWGRVLLKTMKMMRDTSCVIGDGGLKTWGNIQHSTLNVEATRIRRTLS
jgi:hypothetical protein